MTNLDDLVANNEANHVCDIRDVTLIDQDWWCGWETGTLEVFGALAVGQFLSHKSAYNVA